MPMVELKKTVEKILGNRNDAQKAKKENDGDQGGVHKNIPLLGGLVKPAPCPETPREGLRQS
ncbi:hypothetical protein MASR2M78_03750 [Treponema sp.]